MVLGHISILKKRNKKMCTFLLYEDQIDSFNLELSYSFLGE